MLDKLPLEILTIIGECVFQPKDYLNLYMTCKYLKNFLKTELRHASIHLKSISCNLIFLKELKALNTLVIQRNYDSVLDMASLSKNKHLHFVYVNNKRNLVNTPHCIVFTYGNEILIPTDDDIGPIKKNKKYIEEYDYWSSYDYGLTKYMRKQKYKIKLKNNQNHCVQIHVKSNKLQLCL